MILNSSNFRASVTTSKLCLRSFSGSACLAKILIVVFTLGIIAVPSVLGQSGISINIKAPTLIDLDFSLPRPESISVGSNALATFPIPTPTQKPSIKETFKASAIRFGRDQKDLYSAPFRRSNLKWDALFLAGTAGLLATDKRAIGEIDGSHAHLSNHVSDAGLYGGAAAVGAIWLTGIATHNEHARETGFLTAEAMANIMPVYIGLQLLTGRERPSEGFGHGRFEQNNSLGSSLPSGHAIVSWGIAAIVAREYPKPWVKWLAYGAATAVSVTRFTGRDHFPSDVVVGSALGYLIGRQIFRHHCDPALSEACPR